MSPPTNYYGCKKANAHLYNCFDSADDPSERKPYHCKDASHPSCPSPTGKKCMWTCHSPGGFTSAIKMTETKSTSGDAKDPTSDKDTTTETTSHTESHATKTLAAK